MGSILVPNTPQSGMTLIRTTTLTGSSIVLSSIPQTYNNLRLVIRNYLPATDDQSLRFRLNNDSGANRYNQVASAVASGVQTFNADNIQISGANDNAITQSLIVIDIPDYTNTVTWKIGTAMAINNDPTTTTSFRYNFALFVHNQTVAISSLAIYPASGNFTSGTLLLYGEK